MAKTKLGWWEQIRTILYAIGLAIIFRSFLFEPFHIPSGSMRPGLLEGDFLFVSKYSYGYSRYSFPFGARVNWLDDRVWKDLPKRGDVAVFRNPKMDEVNFIKRVMGLPGDRIRVVDGKVILNGQELAYERIDDFVFEVPNEPNKPILRYKETLPDGHTSEVLDITTFGRLDTTREFTVPEGHVFMMGDNRDDSEDSRAMEAVGFVPIENLVGRAEIIVVSFDVFSDIRFYEVWNWWKLLRDDRFFKVIQ